MTRNEELKYYDEIKDWNFDMFEIETESVCKFKISHLIDQRSF